MTQELLQKILYVEDESDIQAIAQLSLEGIGGFTLQVCSSGEEALKQGPAFKPDLIMLDVMMPGMDGPQTYAGIKQIQELREKPVIFMTAKAKRSDIENYLQLGAVGVIPKPFDPMTLCDKIREIWEKL